MNGDPTSMEVRGRDLISGLPRKTTVTAEEIRESLQEPVTQIIDAVKHTLELAKPELAADLVENGITMAGGSSLLRGLTTVLSQRDRSGGQAGRRSAHLRRARHAVFIWKPGTVEGNDGIGCG